MSAASSARVENLAGGADEGAPPHILLLSRLLAYQHEGCIGRAFAEHGLGGVPVKLAAGAAPGLGREQPDGLGGIVDPLFPE